MKHHLLTLGAVALLVSAGAAQASMVQWRFDGVFTEVNAVDPQPDIAVGLPFAIVVSFDSDAALVPVGGPLGNPKALDPTDGSGFRYRFSNASLGMTFTAGSIGPLNFPNEILSAILVRDNFAVDPNNPNSPSVDGITFQLIDAFADQVNGVNIDDTFSVAFRSFDQGLFDVTNDKIPALPSLDFGNLQANFFQYCANTHGTNDCAYGNVNGAFLSVTQVPEPGTAALMGLALVAGVGARRRARAAG